MRGVVPLEPAAELEVELVLAVDVGPGFDMPVPPDAARVPAMVRAHDDAVGILMEVVGWEGKRTTNHV